MKKAVATLTLLAMAMTQSGCSTIVAGYKTNNKISDEQEKVSSFMGVKSQKNELINIKKGIYVDKTPIKVNDQKSQILNVYSGNIVISSKTPMAMRELADRIAKITGISVNYSDPIINTTTQTQGGMAGAPSIGVAPPMAAGAHGMPGMPGMMGADGFPSLSNLSLGGVNGSVGDNMGFPSDVVPLDANFDGKLIDFLDHVANRTGLSWRFEATENRIVFFRYESKTYSLYVMPGTLEMKATLTNASTSSSAAGGASGGSSSGSASQSTSGQEATLTTSVKVWDDTIKSIEKMLSKYGRVNGNEALGTIAVTDTPMILSNISRYIDVTNQAMSRQVSFDVAIYDVTLDKANQTGINWNFVWSEAQKFAIGYGAVSPTATALSNGTGLVLGGPAGTSPTLGAFTGSSAVIQALETQGNVALRAKTQAVTINNTPIPIKVADETTYLASSGSGSTNTGASSGAAGGVLTTSLQPGKVVTGLTMTLLPRVFDANQMMLQMSLDLSTLKSIATITSGTQSIQAPKVGSKSFIERVALRNDQTLIMSGFDQTKDSFGMDSSMDIPGGLNIDQNHVITVIMIKPRITDGLTGL